MNGAADVDINAVALHGNVTLNGAVNGANISINGANISANAPITIGAGGTGQIVSHASSGGGININDIISGGAITNIIADNGLQAKSNVSGGQLTLQSRNGNISINAVNGNAALSVNALALTGDVLLNGTISGANISVDGANITANGSITTGAGGSTQIISHIKSNGAVILHDTIGGGTSTTVVADSGLQATAAVAGGTLTLQSRQGNISSTSLTGTGDITVEALALNGNVMLSGNVSGAAVTIKGANITVTAPITIGASNTGNILSHAGSNGSVKLGAVSGGNATTITADRDLETNGTISGGQLTLNSRTGSITTNALNGTGDLTISATSLSGNITLNESISGANVSLSGANITINEALTVGATGTGLIVSHSGSLGAIKILADLNGGSNTTITADNGLSATEIIAGDRLTLQSRNSQVAINRVNATGNVSINALSSVGNVFLNGQIDGANITVDGADITATAPIIVATGGNGQLVSHTGSGGKIVIAADFGGGATTSAIADDGLTQSLGTLSGLQVDLQSRSGNIRTNHIASIGPISINALSLSGNVNMNGNVSGMIVTVDGANINVNAPIAITAGGDVQLRSRSGSNGTITLGADIGGGSNATVIGDKNVVRDIGTISATNQVTLESRLGDIGAVNSGPGTDVFVTTASLSATARGGIAVTSTGSLNLLNSAVGNAFTLRTMSDGAITLSGSIAPSGALPISSITLIADGRGSIIQNTAVELTATTVSLDSSDGSIGAAFNPVQTRAGALSVHTGGGGDVFLSNTGAVVLADSHAGNIFSLINNGNVTTTGNTHADNVSLQTNESLQVSGISALQGNLTLTAGFGPHASTAVITVDEEKTLAAIEGNVIIRNFDQTNGVIRIGKGSVITAETATSNPLGQVQIYLGALPTLAPGTTPSNVQENKNNGFILYGNNGITALSPDNKVTAINGLVAFDTKMQGPDAIQLGGGASIISRGQKAPDPALGSLDLTNPAVINEILTLQSDGYIQGNLRLVNGALTGSAKLTPRSVANTIFAENIPASVQLSFAGFSTNNPININIDGYSTTRQVLINGSQSFVGSSSAHGVVNIISNQPGPVLILANGAQLTSSGSLSLSANGDVQLLSSVSVGTSLNVITSKGGGTITVSNLTAQTSINLAATGDISRLGQALFDTRSLTMSSTVGSIGSKQNPILTNANQIAANAGGDAYLNTSGVSSTSSRVYLSASSAGDGKEFSLAVSGGKTLDVLGTVAAATGRIEKLSLTVDNLANILGRTSAPLTAAHIVLLAQGGSIGSLDPAFHVAIGGGSLHFAAAEAVYLSGSGPVTLETSAANSLSMLSSASVALAPQAVVSAYNVTLSTPMLILADGAVLAGGNQLSISSPVGSPLTVQAPGGTNQFSTLSASAILLTAAPKQDLNFQSLAPSKSVIAFVGQTRWNTSAGGSVFVGSGTNILVTGGDGQLSLTSPSTMTVSGGGDVNAAAGANIIAGANGNLIFSGDQRLTGVATLIAANGQVMVMPGVQVTDTIGAGSIIVKSPNPVVNPAGFLPAGALVIDGQSPFKPLSGGTTGLFINTSAFNNSASITVVAKPQPVPPTPPTPPLTVSVSKSLNLSLTLTEALQSANNGQKLGLIEKVPLDGISHSFDEKPGRTYRGSISEDLNSNAISHGSAILGGRLVFNDETMTFLQEAGLNCKGNGASELTISKGKVVLAPANDVSVKTNDGIVLICAGAIVYLVETGNDTAVFNLSDKNSGDVQILSGKKKISVFPGRVTVLTRDKSEFSKIYPCPEIACREGQSYEMGSGYTAHIAEFSIPSALSNVRILQSMLQSKDQHLRKSAVQVLKMGAISQIMSVGKPPFRRR